MLIAFKKYLKSNLGQSTVEYAVIFIVFALAMGVIIVKSRQTFESHFEQARTGILK